MDILIVQIPFIEFQHNLVVLRYVRYVTERFDLHASSPTRGDREFLKMQDLIFGYGSLINCESRMSNGGSSECLYVRVVTTAWKRAWSFRSTTGFTALGLLRDDDGAMNAINGVIFKCPRGEQDLDVFDKRESGYRRCVTFAHRARLLSLYISI